MIEPAPSLDEQARLEALYACEILDTLPESAFEELVELAQRVCATPAAAISFIDSDRQWIKAGRGLDGSHNIPRQHAFCNYTIGGAQPLVVTDASQDARFADNPFVTPEGGVRFYAGVPLVVGAGAHVGTLCVLDRTPRALDPLAQSTLEILARQVGTQLELRRQRTALQEQLAQAQIAARQAKLAHALLQCLVDAGDTDAAWGQCAGILGQALGAAAGAVWWVEAGGGALVNRGGYWTLSAQAKPFADASLQTAFRPGVGLPGAVWRSGSTLWLDDVVSEPQVPRLTAALASGLVSAVAVPLAHKGQVRGVVELFFAQRPERGEATQALLATAMQEFNRALDRHSGSIRGVANVFEP